MQNAQFTSRAAWCNIGCMKTYIVFLNSGKTIEIEAERVLYCEKTNCITFSNERNYTIARFTMANIAGYTEKKYGGIYEKNID